MNSLKTQLHLFTKKQRAMNFSIRLKFASKAALTDYYNISNKKKKLIILTIKLKINIKRHDDVITTSNNRLKNFKNNKRIKNKLNLVYKITITNNKEKTIQQKFY